MKILVAGPLLTGAVADATGIDLAGLPPGTAPTPLGTLAAGLLQSGLEVEIITCDPSVTEPQRFDRGGLQITYCPLRAPPKYKTRVRMADLFAAEIRHLKSEMIRSTADIIHAHWTYEYAESALRSGKPNLITMHDLGWDYLLHFRDAYRLMRLAMKYRVMLRAKNITVVDGFMLDKVWQYGFRGKASVVPNPIGLASWHEKETSPLKIVSIGNAGRIKNITASVAAFDIIKSRHADAQLHLFGPGLDANSSFAHAGGVVPHGIVPHAELMRFLCDEATVMIHPARLETFGVSIGEAKMRGVPAVAGLRAKGTTSVIGNEGALVDIMDPLEIARAVDWIISDQETYRDLQRASHEDMVARFSVESVTALYLSTYRQVLDTS